MSADAVPSTAQTSTTGTPPRRCAIVGLGARAELYTTALAQGFNGTTELAALCDTNHTRMKVHNELIADHTGPVPAYHASQFRTMLAREHIDLAVVCTVDRTHDDYIVAALDAGCDVVTEKPMTIDAARCRSILAARERSGRSVTVTFNYRYNPVHEKVFEVLASGAIGDIGSVHFEWLLDLRHGADYFRRWHRDKANSGGLMVHKSTHHFDLVNWWLQSTPEHVYALGNLFFYGKNNGTRRGLARNYERAHGSPESAHDPFALILADSPRLTALYLDAENEDGYARDQNVFGDGITIEDDAAVLVRYQSGATMTYHLTAYSPWEGYRIAFNGSAGRLELLVEETTHVSPRKETTHPAVLHGAEASKHSGRTQLTLHPFWQPPQDIPVHHGQGGHGGGDQRMLADIFGSDTPDPLKRHATDIDGARSLVTGLAANRSFDTGQPVEIRDILAL